VTERKRVEEVSEGFGEEKGESGSLMRGGKESDAPPLERKGEWFGGVLTEEESSRIGGTYERKAALRVL
jgi:hypothetical protein